MPDPDLGDLLSVAHEAVDSAVRYVRAQRPREIQAKGDRDLVTDIDLAVEHAARARLRRDTPAIGFLGEETGTTGYPTLYWVLDPIDGTANFVHGLPLCGIALGLIHDDSPVLGVIALPFLGNRYWATRGDGAHRDGARITVSTTSTLPDAIISLSDYGTGDDTFRNRLSLALDRDLTPRARGVRRLGSAAVDLAWVADGRLDANITVGNRTWDTAAGAIIAREAGAAVLDADGSPHTTRSRCIIATTPGLRNAIMPLLRVAQGTPFWASPDTAAPTASREASSC